MISSNYLLYAVLDLNISNYFLYSVMMGVLQVYESQNSVKGIHIFRYIHYHYIQSLVWVSVDHSYSFLAKMYISYIFLDNLKSYLINTLQITIRNDQVISKLMLNLYWYLYQERPHLRKTKVKVICTFNILKCFYI